jgi:hypothetical protein
MTRLNLTRGLTCTFAFVAIKRLGTGQFYLISIFEVMSYETQSLAKTGSRITP